jgi:dihydropteroate synthase
MLIGKITSPLIMGVVNVTPDSFSDGGRFFSVESAIEHGFKLIEEGADIIDVGGESSRPGALPVPTDEELSRVIPVVEALAGSVPVSVDTVKTDVMMDAISAGAALINDINALSGIDPAFLADSSVSICLMHMQGDPMTMQRSPSYNDVLEEVYDFLEERVDALVAAGIDKERLLIDPGFGFGKTLEQNLMLLRHLDRFKALGLPILAGLSRKSMLGAITGRGVGERVHASVAASLIAVQKGASIVRVHDVGAMRDALKILNAVEGSA